MRKSAAPYSLKDRSCQIIPRAANFLTGFALLQFSNGLGPIDGLFWFLAEIFVPLKAGAENL
jgi:hypothetical protein